MCIAIYKPKEKTLSEEILRQCFERNSDGAGFAYAKDGVLTVKKGFFTFKSFWEAYSQIPEGVPAIIHFRIKTSGNKDEYNCHPWSVTDNLAIIHNGIISDYSVSGSSISDTGLFVGDILKTMVSHLGEKCLTTDFSNFLLSEALGSSKMVSLDKDGEHAIFNASSGEFVDGVWFSNSSYKGYKSSSSKSTSPKHPSNGDSIHVVYKKGKKYGVCRPGYGSEPMTNKEVFTLRKEYRSKVKKLVNKKVLELVELEGDKGAYQLALSRMSIQSDR